MRHFAPHTRAPIKGREGECLFQTSKSGETEREGRKTNDGLGGEREIVSKGGEDTSFYTRVHNKKGEGGGKETKRKGQNKTEETFGSWVEYTRLFLRRRPLRQK